MILQVSLLFYFLYTASACDSGQYSIVNQTVIVTGAARGIGYGIADNFLAGGAKIIIIVDRNVTSGRAAAATLNSKYGCKRAVFIRCNVYKDQDCFYKIVSQYKTVNVLVNSAGVLDEYALYDMVLTNVVGLITMSLNFRNRNRIDKNGPGGTIINISSRAAYTQYPFLSSYTATKYAIKGFTQNFGHDYNCKRTGIRVVGMCPDFTDTDMVRNIKPEKDQLEKVRKLIKASKYQTADAVGKATLKVFKMAATATLWGIAGGELFKAPESEYIDTATIESL